MPVSKSFEELKSDLEARVLFKNQEAGNTFVVQWLKNSWL